MGIPLNIDWQQILLHLFNFIILTGGLYFLLYSPISKFIKKRDDYYRNLDKEAKERLESARELENQAKARLESIDDEIKENIIKAESELDAYTKSQTDLANAKAEKIISDAKKTAEDEKRAIINSVDKEIINMTKAATRKIIRSSTDEAYAQFLDIAERDVDNDQ